MRADIRPDCRLSDYIYQPGLNAYCWMHQPGECPYDRPTLTGFRRWWVWNDGPALLVVISVPLVAVLLFFALLFGGA